MAKTLANLKVDCRVNITKIEMYDQMFTYSIAYMCNYSRVVSTARV